MEISCTFCITHQCILGHLGSMDGPRLGGVSYPWFQVTSVIVIDLPGLSVLHEALQSCLDFLDSSKKRFKQTTVFTLISIWVVRAVVVGPQGDLRFYAEPHVTESCEPLYSCAAVAVVPCTWQLSDRCLSHMRRHKLSSSQSIFNV